MTNEEIQKKLDLLKTKLNKATKEKNTTLINTYICEMNSLWEKASSEMFENAKKDGIYTDDTSK
tara:strand:+ start:28 stop:219 length:192 start_codon:yes stop_codon:yes gene_type:complete